MKSCGQNRLRPIFLSIFRHFFYKKCFTLEHFESITFWPPLISSYKLPVYIYIERKQTRKAFFNTLPSGKNASKLYKSHIKEWLQMTSCDNWSNILGIIYERGGGGHGIACHRTIALFFRCASLSESFMLHEVGIIV